MKYYIIKIPIVIWLLLFAIIHFFYISPILPSPFNSNSIVLTGSLLGSAINISNKIYDNDGQYKLEKYLWWILAAMTILGVIICLFARVPYTIISILIIHIIMYGIGYRLVEHYAVYHYHYLQTKKKG